MKILVFLLFLLMSNLSSAGSLSDAFKQSPIPQPTTKGNAGSTIAKMSAACQKLQGSQLFNSAMELVKTPMVVTSPVMPYVGFIAGSMSNKSMLMNICELVIGIDKASTQGIVLQTGAFLNTLTGNKFDDYYNLVDKSFDLANSIYDFESGKYKVGSMVSAYTHGKIKEEMNAINKVYQKRVNKKNVDSMESTAERRAQLDSLSQASYQRAILRESSTCPAPSGTTDFMLKYSNFVQPKKFIIEDETINIDFYYDMLMKMGPEFLIDVGDEAEYSNAVNQIMHWSVSYVQTEQNFEQKDSQLTGYLGRDGLPEKKDRKVVKKVTLYSPRFSDQNVSTFKNKYLKRWEKWVNSQYLTTGMTGLFDDKKGRIEAKYRSYAFECSDRNITKKLNITRDDPEFSKKIKKEADSCQENLKVRENEVKNLMESYMDKLVTSLKNKKKAETDIWNFEAQNLGYNRDISNVTKPGNPKEYQSTDVACSPVLSESELRQLSLKNNKVNLSLKEQWAQADSKELMMEEMKAKSESDAMDATQENIKSHNGKMERIKDKSNNIPAVPMQIKGGL